MSRRLLLVILISFVVRRWGVVPDAVARAETIQAARVLGLDAGAEVDALRCVAFSPYVSGYDAQLGPHPPPSVIDTLLDRVIHQLHFRCIMVYGVLNGLDYTVQKAAQLGIHVIMIIWLDYGDTNNQASITRGIQLANAYPQTVIRISCGSEFRTRHGVTHDNVITDCITQLGNAGVTQPITSIDTWWEWCNRSWPCQPWALHSQVDWIGINIFPWWENKYSGLFPCTTAAHAAAFHIARYQDIVSRYPGKPVMVTEFGWPAGPPGYSETNQHTGQHCGIAGEENQRLVNESTLRQFDQQQIPATLFEAFREPWKARPEGVSGPNWGVCHGSGPYACTFHHGLRQRCALPMVQR